MCGAYATTRWATRSNCSDGTGDALSYRIGPSRVYQFSHPEHVSEVLVKKAEAFRKPSCVKFYFRRWLGAGLLLNEGAPWRRQRRKVRLAMRQLPPEQAISAIVDQTRQVFPLRGGREVNVAACMDRLAFYVNVRTLLGDAATEIQEPLFEAANVLHATGIREMQGPSLAPDWLPTAPKRRLREAMALFDHVLIPHAARRQCNPGLNGDLFDGIIAPTDGMVGPKRMNLRQARDEAVNLLMGGKETVSSVLTFTAYLLGKHPQLQEQAAAEVRQVLAGCAPTVGDMERLPLLCSIVKETMRLYPPVHLISREAARSVEIAGYRIRRFSQVHLLIYAMHRDARWFERPEEFDPARFRPDREKAIRPYAYLPFGAGPRRCVGRFLGFQQCVLAMACLLQDYALRLAPKQAEPRLTVDIVLHPLEPLRMILDARPSFRPKPR